VFTVSPIAVYSFRYETETAQDDGPGVNTCADAELVIEVAFQVALNSGRPAPFPVPR
jgi:hypothetical protein